MSVDVQRLAESYTLGPALLSQVALFIRLDELVHLTEGRDAGDALLAERPGISDGPEQLAVDVNGTATHAGDDARLVEVEAGQPAQDHVAAGAGVLEHAEHLGVEGLDFRALHDGATSALHAGANVV